MQAKYSVGDRVEIRERPMEGKRGTIRSVTHHPTAKILAKYEYGIELDDRSGKYASKDYDAYHVIEEGLVRAT